MSKGVLMGHDVLTRTVIRTGPSFSKLNPAAPIFHSTIIMPWPTHMCTKKLTRRFSSVFGLNGLQNETPKIRHKHTQPNHAMPCQPCLASAWRGERAHVCGERFYIQTLLTAANQDDVFKERPWTSLTPTVPVEYHFARWLASNSHQGAETTVYACT